MLNRRHMLKGLAATPASQRLAGALGASATAVAGATAALAQEADVHRFTFGEFEVTVLSDGAIDLPISMLAADMDIETVKALLEERGLPTDTRPGTINVTMLTRGEDRIIIDVGSGPNFMDSAGRLAESIEVAEVEPDSVTHVVLTHAHPDHVWGLIDEFEEAPVFAQADYTISAVEYDFWMAEGRVDLLPDPLKPFALGAQRNLAPVAERTTFASGEHGIVPGVTMIPTPGHTPGHMSVLVESGGAQLLIVGDALTHQVIAFERPDWPFGFDMDHDQASATRQALLKRAAAEKMLLVGYHLPWPGVGRVEEKDGGFRYVAEG